MSIRSSLKVELKPLGCLGVVGAVFSFGLLPLVVRAQEKQFPALLTDEGMSLRNGARIAWKAFTRVHATDFFVEGKYVNCTYELWHTAGKVHFPARRVANIDEVVQFIASHLPPGVQIEARNAGSNALSKAIAKARTKDNGP